MVVDVLTQIKSQQVDKTFSYLVPKELEKKVVPGTRVTIPFGKQVLEGFVISYHVDKDFDYELKPILNVVDEEPVLNEELLKLGDYISKKTICTKTQAYQAMLPSALKAKKGFIVPKKYETYVVLKDKSYVGKTETQKKILQLFTSSDKVSKKEASEISSSSLKTLLTKKVIEEVKEEVYRLNLEETKEVVRHCLNEEQQSAYLQIKKSFSTYQPFLLHGVTGSGKTEVYMHLIEAVLKQQKEVIVLVPEISLTPQFVSLFKSRFGRTVAILHSGLSDGEKYDEWRKIVRKEVSIVIGARSAIFAPFTKLGLIIIDEEHSSTYKQENIPHYDAIDIALRRGKYHHSPVVLGSATPSVESYTKAKSGSYQLLTMKERVNKSMPTIHLVDMKEEMKQGRRMICSLLDEKIKERLEKREQIILLLNRRGFSTVLSCHDCGYTDKCPNCDIPLTYHKASGREKCHYCGYMKPLLQICPECHSREISQFGMGTQKLEEYLKETYSARILRMDVDTTTRKGSHKKMIDSFSNHEYDILVGTQMIAKGLDFKDVTLVGVLQADNSLNIPDFRSGERTYQLLSQVAGRSGRANKLGEVIFQGFNMDHYSIKKASKHDYRGFYEEEMNLRKTLNYPPYCQLVSIKVSGKKMEEVMTEITKITNFLRRECKKEVILGPSQAMIPKINLIYYMQTIMKYQTLKDVYPMLHFIYEKYKTKKNVYVEVDINPSRL